MNEKYLIRKATKADGPAIELLCYMLRAFQFRFIMEKQQMASAMNFSRTMADSYYTEGFLVAEKIATHEIVGMAQYSLPSPLLNDHRGEVELLFVRQKDRHQGVGTSLVKSVKSLISSDDVLTSMSWHDKRHDGFWNQFSTKDQYKGSSIYQITI